VARTDRVCVAAIRQNVEERRRVYEVLMDPDERDVATGSFVGVGVNPH
jgi:hypothetical protein